MIDYKPIADAMRHCKYKTTYVECKACAIHGFCKKYKGFIEDYAADVIEHLQKERDAAVADIEHRCNTCRHWNTELNHCPCSECYLEASAYYSHAKWEWRGVQE